MESLSHDTVYYFETTAVRWPGCFSKKWEGRHLQAEIENCMLVEKKTLCWLKHTALESICT